MRGEFYFLPDDQIGSIAKWKGNVWFRSPDDALLLDRNGDLAAALRPLVGPTPERDTAQVVEGLVYNFINLTIFGGNVLARGELARAMELLSLIHRKLLHMARLVERSTAHWPTPSRKVEQELSAASYARFRSCASGLTPTGIYVLIGHDHFGRATGRVFGSLPRFMKLVALSPFTRHLPQMTGSMPSKKEVMSALKESLETGTLTPVIDRTYPLSEAAQALRYLQEGHARGRILIAPWQEGHV